MQVVRTLTIILIVGWTTQEAAEIRAGLASFAEDWDDPAMDAYDGL